VLNPPSTRAFWVCGLRVLVFDVVLLARLSIDG